MDPVAFIDAAVEGGANQGSVSGVGADHNLETVALGAEHASHPCAPGSNFSFETSRPKDCEHGAHHRIGNDARVCDQTHFDRAFFVFHAVIEFLGVDHPVQAIEILQVFDQTCGNDLARSEERDVVHLFSGSGADYILEALGADGILLVRELQEFDFVDLRAGAFGQLLRDVTSFQPRNHVKSVWADHARDLLD